MNAYTSPSNLQFSSPKKRKIIWAPQPGSQPKFLTCPAFEVLYHSNRGPGKTDSLLMAFGQFVGQGFGEDWVGVIFRRTFPELKYLIEASKKWFPKIWPGARYNIKDSEWTWPTGEKLLFRFYFKEADYWSYHGHAYPFIGWDELCTWKDLDGYKRLMSCCRSTNPNVPRMVRATTNPYGPNHNNVKHHFQLPAKDGVLLYEWYEFEDPDTGKIRKEKLHKIAIKGHLFENKILLRAQPGYVAQLRKAARNEAELKAWIDGDWNIVAGGMFDDIWNQKYHVLEPFPIPPTWIINRSFDWGSTAPFSVGWWAQSDGCDITLPDGRIFNTIKGDIFRINEWYGWNGEPNVGLKMLATDITKGIIERELKWGLRTKKHCRVNAGPADTNIFNAEDGNCIATNMAGSVIVDKHKFNGVQWVRADKRPGSRKTGWEQIRIRLKNALPPSAREPKEEGVRDKPGMFIFSNCAQFIRTVPVLSRDDKDLDDVDTKTEDHIGDETRYRVRVAGLVIGQSSTIGMH